MKHLAVLAGFSLYCLGVWTIPKVVMALSGLAAAFFLCLIIYGLLDSSPSGSKGGWESKDIDGHD